MRSVTLSRRDFMQRAGAAGFAISGAGGLLAACGGIEGESAKRTATPSATAAVNHPKVPFERLDFANWPLYIDKQVIKDFEAETGAKVKYVEEINDNEEFFGKIRQPLASGDDIKRDIIVLTDWMAARLVRLSYVQEIDTLNRDGQIRRFTGNDYTQDLTRGNLAMAQAYSGDVIQLKAANPDLEFVIPEEGATLWSDNMLIPINAAEPYGAEAYMNYVYDPKVAAKVAAYVNYVTPVVGAKEELAKTDPKLAEDELIFPSEETLANLHPFVTLTEDEERQMTEAYQAVIGA